MTGVIITVGFCPCWDVTCAADGIDWGEHKRIGSRKKVPAGKAFNISRALAWLGSKNIAAGLWGRNDYQQMAEAVESLSEYVKINFTVAKGATRENITVVDTQANREMHLRMVCELASKESLKQLGEDLKAIVSRGSVCVFAGSMPGGDLLGDCLSIIDMCKDSGARVAVDTSGDAFGRIVEGGGLWLIKPNLEELCELLDETVEDDAVAITEAAGKLREKSEVIIVSRGQKGAVLVSGDEAVSAELKSSREAIDHTVGCGDYLLAGFIDGLVEKADNNFALERAIKVATARAYGYTDTAKWADTENRIDVELIRLVNR